jgi:hypothetical protein
MVAALLLGSVFPVSAQNSVSASSADALKGSSETVFSESMRAPGDYSVPVVPKAQGELPEGGPVYASQDSATLGSRESSEENVESVVDLSVLREPSPYRKAAVKAGPQPYEVETNSLQNGLAQISAIYRESGKPAETSDCSSVALAVGQRIRLDSSKILEVVESEVAANPACACEIVKISIKSSEADVAQVVGIVEAAINAAPDSMRIISQCAIATMPESIAEVQALLAKLDPNSGDDGYSSKSAKSAKGAKDQVAAIVAPMVPNPLDLPPFPPVVPPIIIPPVVSNVNP